MDAFKSLIQPLVGGHGGSSVIDGMKLVVLGGTVETARRVSSSAWSHFVNSFFLTAHFSEEDFPYDWLMLWLSRRPEWQRSREFETTTRTAGPGGSSSSHYSAEDADWDQWEVAESNNSNGWDPDSESRPKTRVVFQPTYDTTHTIFYRGHWLRVRRGKKQDTGTEMLSISVVARSNAILKQLVLQAKKEYEAEAVHRIQIYFADAHGSWRWTDSRHKRPLSSIVLNPGVKEMLVDDARDFLKSEKWYADRGIPFRRGYLLHGVPGSGKSSLIHALAGQLQLDIYVVSLSASWISDNTLTNLMGRVPARCVLLLEDLDAAFVRSTNRDDDNLDDLGSGDNQQGGSGVDLHAFPGYGGGLGGGFGGSRRRYGRPGLSDMNTLSLSGLLNALDGVAASEGRLLFATTNHLERLDPALSRPGRMDVWVEFKNASKWQAEALFRNFFPCEEEEIVQETDPELEGLDIDVQVQDKDGNVRTFVPNEQRVNAAANGKRSDERKPLWSLSTSFASSASSLISGSLPSSASLMASGSTSPMLSSPSETMSPPLPRTFSGSPIPDSPGSNHIAMDKDQFGASNTAYLPPPPDPSLNKVKPLDRKTLAALAKKFADGLPEDEFSVAGLQGYLLKHKAQPEAAANGVEEWVKNEREMRERLKREKEAREIKEKALREKRRKEAQEKEKQKKAQDKKDQELEKIKKLIAEKEKEEELEKMRQQLKDKEAAKRKKKKDAKKKSKSKDKEDDDKDASDAEEEIKDQSDNDKAAPKEKSEAKQNKKSSKKTLQGEKKVDDTKDAVKEEAVSEGKEKEKEKEKEKNKSTTKKSKKKVESESDDSDSESGSGSSDSDSSSSSSKSSKSSKSACKNQPPLPYTDDEGENMPPLPPMPLHPPQQASWSFPPPPGWVTEAPWRPESPPLWSDGS
ncbi:putative mitochondrial chaperone BCS1-B [Psilocybe cubensis]|uniref:Mitochondrial chaperone BCS1-B n=2 Tax=Psilocybe cubensis TaxID=181762 RepID=A0ACB8HAR2_PSICU|nr:putative mitochondrial chaperone BCS1-B [Psilocybe cubensis]KAH9484752.1 putative mitochondrial chaperone BCS1-B [Psilocybe cubensis]